MVCDGLVSCLLGWFLFIQRYKVVERGHVIVENEKNVYGIA